MENSSACLEKLRNEQIVSSVPAGSTSISYRDPSGFQQSLKLGPVMKTSTHSVSTDCGFDNISGSQHFPTAIDHFCCFAFSCGELV